MIDTTQALAWAFLILFTLLAATSIMLIYMLTMQFRKHDNMERTFKREACNLIFILCFFGSTYFIRFFSDYFIVPDLLDEPDPSKLTCNPVVKGGELSFCPSFKFILYYMTTTLLWDFLPIGLILVFHYRNFMPKDF